MNKATAFFRLIRWPNLLFILLTQWLFFLFIYRPLAAFPPPVSELRLFVLLTFASVLIAAAGYIINDYFDVQIDAVNKPDRMIIGRGIGRRWAIVLHWVLSGAGLLLSAWVTYRTRVLLIFFVNAATVAALWFYSVSLKRKLLSGNVVVAALTAWVLFVVYFFCRSHAAGFPPVQYLSRLVKFTFLYGGFAFVMTLVREVIKDLEDIEGDRRYDCRTMPIAMGVPASKVFTAVWVVACIGAVSMLSVYSWLFETRLGAVIAVIAIIVPMTCLLKLLKAAKEPADFHRMSTLAKVIMLAGILSMLIINLPRL